MIAIAAITGAASGIGLATTRRLLNEGWAVIALDISESQLAAARKALSNYADRLTTLVCDVASAAQVESVFAQIKARHPSINALICCAGVLRLGALENMPVEEFDLVFNVNTRGPWLCARAALPLLKPAAAAGQVARIVLLSSIAALRPKIGGGAYAGSKAALSQLTRVLAVECGSSGILVNAIAPGTVDTPMIRAVSNSSAQRGTYRPSGASPLGRIAMPEDVASVVWFLLGDDARYITGTTIPVDGGTSAAFVPPAACG
jgi:NAD(P)-dependent dehydrogenase (short-subunit alcohol dehydrogenase family)